MFLNLWYLKVIKKPKIEEKPIINTRNTILKDPPKKGIIKERLSKEKMNFQILISH